LEKKIESFEAKQVTQLRQELLQKVEKVGGIDFIGAQVEVGNADNLKKLSLELKPLLAANHLIVLAAVIGGKPSVSLAVSESLNETRGWDAVKIIKEKIAGLIKGGGGGQKTLAAAGGQDAGQLQQVVQAVKELAAG